MRQPPLSGVTITNALLTQVLVHTRPAAKRRLTTSVGSQTVCLICLIPFHRAVMGRDKICEATPAITAKKFSCLKKTPVASGVHR